MGYVGRRCGWFVDQRCDIGQCSVVGTLYRPPSAQTARADDHWRIQEEAPITSVKLVSDSHSDSFSDSKMHNCKSKTKLIHEIQGGARGATYGLLNCVENNLKNRDN